MEVNLPTLMNYKLIKYDQKWDIHTNICYIYHIDNIYIGSCTLQIMNDANHPMKILSFYIDDRYRNMGFGKMMLSEVVSDISDDCTLMVRKDNDKAIYMYKQVGFEFYSSEIDNDIEYIWMYRYKEKISEILNGN